jgi:hypothetical protein
MAIKSTNKNLINGYCSKLVFVMLEFFEHFVINLYFVVHVLRFNIKHPTKKEKRDDTCIVSVKSDLHIIIPILHVT